MSGDAFTDDDLANAEDRMRQAASRREPTVNAEELRRLSEAATPGRWGAFGMSLYAGTTGDVDTSAQIADFYTTVGGHPRTFDLDLTIALVNLYRSNQLQVIERDRLARALRGQDGVLEGWDWDDQSPPGWRHLQLADAIIQALDSTTGDERG